MLAEGVPVGAGTDATRVSSYNPWTSLYWLVSGRTVGGLALHPQGLSRDTALELFTHGSAWFSSEQGKKGQIKVGQLADLIALSADYFHIEDEGIKGIEAVLTIVDGKIVYGSVEFEARSATDPRGAAMVTGVQGARALEAAGAADGPGPSMCRRVRGACTQSRTCAPVECAGQ
jgi:hypothetical protein